MTKGISEMYLNMVETSDELDTAFQTRAFALASRTKDDDLAAALARRPDTIDDIDTALMSWGSAKVQSAWFARPGRDIAAAVERLRKEKRVTILEVVAQLEDLPEDVYTTCAKRDSVRVAIPLFANQKAPTSARLAAASTLAKNYPSMSWSKKSALLPALAASDTDALEAFVASATSLETIRAAVSSTSSIPVGVEDGVLRVVHTHIKHVPSLYKAAADESRNRSNRYYASKPYELQRLFREILDIAQDVAVLATGESTLRTELVSDLTKLITTFEKKANEFDETLNTLATGIVAALTSTSSSSRTSLLEVINNITSSELLQSTVTEAQSKRTLDRSAAIAALCHPDVTIAIAEIALTTFGWSEVSKILDARGRVMQVPIRALLLVVSHSTSDEGIEKYAHGANPSDLWMEVVSLYANRGYLPETVMNSKYANAEIVPRLPLSLFKQQGLPGWMVAEFTKLVSSELTSPAAWDAFEILAPSHLGSVSQIIRASKLTTQHMATPASA